MVESKEQSVEDIDESKKTIRIVSVDRKSTCVDKMMVNIARASVAYLIRRAHHDSYVRPPTILIIVHLITSS